MVWVRVAGDVSIGHISSLWGFTCLFYLKDIRSPGFVDDRGFHLSPSASRSLRVPWIRLRFLLLFCKLAVC